jgi:hypothetical protein
MAQKNCRGFARESGRPSVGSCGAQSSGSGWVPSNRREDGGAHLGVHLIVLAGVMSEPGSGVPSRIDRTISKSASFRAASSSSSNACAKKTISARADSGDQSALLRVTPAGHPERLP